MPHAQNRIVKEAFHRIRRGESPAISEIAHTLRMSPNEISNHLQIMLEHGSITLEEESITGAGGLSTTVTPHQLRLDGVDLFCWCALDTLGIPSALGSNASVSSPYASNGEIAKLEFEKGRLTKAPTGIFLQLAPPSQARLLCGGT